jgi:hypothetical protein
MTYPKWVQRTPDLGPILAVNAEEEAEFSLPLTAEFQHEPSGDEFTETPPPVKNKGGRPRKVQ